MLMGVNPSNKVRPDIEGVVEMTGVKNSVRRPNNAPYRKTGATDPVAFRRNKLPGRDSIYRSRNRRIE